MAREMSRKGKKVILCEAGKYHTWFGYTASAMNILEAKGMIFSKEGNWSLSAETAGGGSVVYGGLGFKPPAWLKERYGIDLKTEVDEVYEEVPVRALPDTHIGPGAQKIMQAARELGLDWKPSDRFIRADKCRPDCSACMHGCKEGAKWTAREYLDEAVRNGAELLLQTKVARSFSKPVDPGSSFRLNKGAVFAEEILMGAGVRRQDIVTTTAFEAHQLSSVRIGDLLDKNCQTPISGCYCMDASVIPGEWGFPPW